MEATNTSSKRARVVAIMQDSLLSFKEKHRRAQAIYSEDVMTPEVASGKKDDRDGDGRFDRTFRSPGGGYGCPHYKRNCRIKAECCGTFFTCRICHDENCRHNIDRFATKTMVCMYCHTVQPIAADCANNACGKQMASYFCAKCRLFDDDYAGFIFHCDDCGLCRKADRGDYYHCKNCNTCLSASAENHVCLERSLDSNCPICNEYLFTSMKPIQFPDCRHPMHQECLEEYARHSYTCPVCVRSLWQNDEYIRRVDAHVAKDVMPPEFENCVSEILCNDCLQSSICKFHFLYHKCIHCSAYNTRVVRSGPRPLPPVQQTPHLAAEAPGAPTAVLLSPRAPNQGDAMQLDSAQSSPVNVRPPPLTFSSPTVVSMQRADQESPLA